MGNIKFLVSVLPCTTEKKKKKSHTTTILRLSSKRDSGFSKKSGGNVAHVRLL
jgi:hypothetical protein